MMRALPILILAALVAPSCEFLAMEADLESDPRWVALTEEVQDRTLEVQALMGENELLYQQLKGEELSAEMAAQAAYQVAENLEKLAELADLQQRAQIDLDAIAAEYEIPEWQLYLATAASALVGMGVPTSGPLAPLLAGVAPLLERFGIRNRRKREKWHEGRDD